MSNSEKELVITISADGKSVEIEALGYKGKGCAKDIAEISKKIGKKTKSKKKKEYYVSEQVDNKKRIREGGK